MAVKTHGDEASTAARHCFSGNLSWLLNKAHYVLATEMIVGFAPLGVSPRGYHVLAAAAGGEHTQTELADIIGLDKTTMVVTIDELEEAGLAERCPVRNDRRARVIKVTKAGKRKISEGEAVIERVQNDVLQALPPGQRHALVESLSTLVADRLSAPVECDAPPRRRQPRR
ncbi:MAG: MarR family transcriptional regulator, transcriptional regulator for hemolysin [Solirubrobacteraceae bacterium]|jgi:DNA-binding MarR family transcriptional regulator|nr:MarR family transcriptional regulator, transcriptional regulator for hemolysin [Solirubrobacteraceae bacterium]